MDVHGDKYVFLEAEVDDTVTMHHRRQKRRTRLSKVKIWKIKQDVHSWSVKKSFWRRKRQPSSASSLLPTGGVLVGSCTFTQFEIISPFCGKETRTPARSHVGNCLYTDLWSGQPLRRARSRKN